MASKKLPEITSVALIGCGAMGGGLALLFAEQGLAVGLRDPLESQMDKVIEMGKKDGVKGKLTKYANDKDLCAGLTSPKTFVWSLPHGDVGDHVLAGLMPYLEKGDIIIDCANEHYTNTERRQGKCGPKGIRYVGCGVSGGYQAARRGPSMCPGSDDETMAIVLPILSKIAAKAPDGTPCVAHIGTGGGGHYCKMIHNGIEHGMMSAIAEAWAIMHKGLGMDLDAIGDELHKWNKSGELEGTFLVRIGAEICHTKAPDGTRVLETVGDKVVQDYCGEEGTGIWSNTEAVDHHVPAPTLTASHFMRVASADLAQRREIVKTFENKTYPPQAINTEDKAKFLEDLRLATYISCLASFTQGLNVIDKADKANHFNVDYAALLQIWRAGCIIQADFISEKLLQPIYKDYANKKEKNPLYEPVIAKEFSRSYDALKRVVLAATVADHPIPALANTLDYIKYQTSTDLPTSFSEAQLDYFGRHMYDLKGSGDPEGLPDLGKHHFEWKPA